MQRLIYADPKLIETRKLVAYRDGKGLWPGARLKLGGSAVEWWDLQPRQLATALRKELRRRACAQTFRGCEVAAMAWDVERDELVLLVYAKGFGRVLSGQQPPAVELELKC